MTNKQFTFIMLLLIISFGLMFLCLKEITLKNEYNLKCKYIDCETGYYKDYMGLYWANQNSKFDYFNGLWLMFVGIGMFCLFAIIQCELKDFNKKS
jgi:hypothetical protein